MTSNGQTLAGHLDELKNAGTDAINISLDTLDARLYAELTGGGDLSRTLEAVESSIDHGIRTKINCLVQRDINPDETPELAKYALERGIDIRFIEMMPVGMGDPSRTVPNGEILERLGEIWPGMTRDEGVHGNGPAVYYRVPGYEGCIGFISPVHCGFCGSCNRIRLTSQGEIRPCLGCDRQFDLKPYLDGDREELVNAIREAVLSKPEAHHFNSGTCSDGSEGAGVSSYMSRIGG